MAAKYEDAHEFLGQLTDRFVDGDRSKVIIIPGNHDIDWNRARAAMEPVDAEDVPSDLQRALHEPGSPYRWSWKSRELFIIKDQETYRERLGAFWRFKVTQSLSRSGMPIPQVKLCLCNHRPPRRGRLQGYHHVKRIQRCSR